MPRSRVQELMLREKALSFLANPDLKLLMFGGKGGVGKTTCSASTAVYLARKYPGRKVLVMSTDPAHSLADSLDCPLGSVARPVEGMGNLWGLEVDAQELMDDYKEKHHRAMRKIAQRGTLLGDRDINRILELILPGLDEMMAVILIADILRERVFDLIIMDTAPTGHTLRLLALPAKMRRWGEVLDLMQKKHRYISKVFTGWYRRDEADVFSKMVADDVASAGPEEAEKRRGAAGMVYSFKMAGAKAQQGADLDEVARVAQKACDACRSIGIAMTPCTVPAAGRPTFEIGEGEMEFGMGIHGEPGVWRGKLRTADEIAAEMLERLLADMPLSSGDRVSVLCNSLGATPPEELYIIYRYLARELGQMDIEIVMPLVGRYATSMEMTGMSVTFCKLDEELEALLKAPASCAFWTV